VQNWPDGHLKLGWTRELLKLRTEFSEVFTHGDYQPLEVMGPHRDHVIAFARRHGRDAVITAVAKSLAPLSQGGRVWPRAATFEGSLNLGGHSVEGISGENRVTDVPLSMLFRHLPVAVLKARAEGASNSRRKRQV
jgi:(1->4)-alpha-D-glucan 1-alpha-D-glucosylmutase